MRHWPLTAGEFFWSSSFTRVSRVPIEPSAWPRKVRPDQPVGRTRSNGFPCYVAFRIRLGPRGTPSEHAQYSLVTTSVLYPSSKKTYSVCFSRWPGRAETGSGHLNLSRASPTPIPGAKIRILTVYLLWCR